MDGAVVADALFRVGATPPPGDARPSGIALQQYGCRIHALCTARQRASCVRRDAATGKAPIPVLVSPASHRARRRPDAARSPARPGGNVPPTLP